MHPYAEKAAEAARCAGTQGKFWEFHDLLFVGKKLQPADLREQARTLNLDQERFDKCLVEGVEAAAVEKDAEEAKSSGITGTPSFLSIVITSVGCLPMLRCMTWSSSN